MNHTGDDKQDILVRARSVLLDALTALKDQRAAVILVGAQAVYMHTGNLNIALAEMTKDADLAIDPRALGEQPLLEVAMRTAGFMPAATGQPGAWVEPGGIPVDLMVPESLGGDGRRGGRIPPHDNAATRKARGLEASLVDHSVMTITALERSDERQLNVQVAGPAALLVAKMHKIFDRLPQKERLLDKDAHDCYRLLQAVETQNLALHFRLLLNHDISRDVALQALEILDEHFASSTNAIGSQMAGRAEEGVGDPTQVSLSTMLLSLDLLNALSQERANS